VFRKRKPDALSKAVRGMKCRPILNWSSYRASP
jgi:hypothetical protein